MASNARHNSRVIAYFTKRLSEHGLSYQSVDWGSAEGQRRRFEVLADIGIGTNDTVLDIGCGLGDFYQFLKERGHTGEYTGIDITPGMVERARIRFAQGRFLNGDFWEIDNTLYDWVTASGIFYLNTEGGAQYVQDSAKKMFQIARKGIAFNCLSASKHDSKSNEFSAKPLEVLENCMSISPNTELRNDYHPRDFSIYMRKVIQ